MVPPFHADLVKGVATYALELFTAVADLDVVYAPIGMGSGISGLITVRDLLGLETEIVGVVADKAPAFALSFDAGHPVGTDKAATFADGMACRDPQPAAFDIIRKGAARILQLTDDEIAEAIRIYYTDTHNLAEGAGAASLAGLMRERERYQGRRAGVILCGGNIDAEVFAEVLSGRTPLVA
jgi:threonine dehydratase